MSEEKALALGYTPKAYLKLVSINEAEMRVSGTLCIYTAETLCM